MRWHQLQPICIFHIDHGHKSVQNMSICCGQTSCKRENVWKVWIHKPQKKKQPTNTQFKTVFLGLNVTHPDIGMTIQYTISQWHAWSKRKFSDLWTHTCGHTPFSQPPPPISDVRIKMRIWMENMLHLEIVFSMLIWMSSDFMSITLIGAVNV